MTWPIISRVITYTYDDLYRLVDADYSTGERFEYAYDAVGNRQALTETLGVTPTVHSYVYDQANRLTSVDGITYTWDANGNLLSDGTRTFAYDAANQLTLVTSGTLTTTFEYDGLGNRVAQTVDGVETSYVLDVAGGLPEVIIATSGGASTYYVQIQGQILAQYGSGAWAYALPDHLGSVRQLSNAGGQVTLAQNYDLLHPRPERLVRFGHHLARCGCQPLHVIDAEKAVCYTELHRGGNGHVRDNFH